MTLNLKEKIIEIESIIFTDPGNRGISSLYQKNSLQKSSEKILKTPKDKKSYILTGFCCLKPSCETDGPLGSSLLNSTLNNLGFNTFLLTDSYSEKVVKASSKNNKIIIEDSYEKFLEKNPENEISIPFGKANKNWLFNTFVFIFNVLGIENNNWGLRIEESTEWFLFIPI